MRRVDASGPLLLKCSRTENGGAFPSPERCRECIQQGAAKNNCGGAQESSPREIHLPAILEAIFGKLRRTIPAPSFTAIILSTGTLVSFSTDPLGQVISRESILVRFPRPKKMRGSLADL